MKSPFSPWTPYVAMIALCAAFALYVGLGQPGRMHIGPLYWPSTTNAVVRSLRGDAPVTATVLLDSGSVTDAEVAPGCFVQVGDRVIVRASTDASESKKLLVFPVYAAARN
ncbi:MAG TPA: hypothetical protein VFL30_10945 [Rhodanobacteraceae bacterium]|nr:hypothetical protein [Rhodanobacteraceae bacterium]